MTPAFSKKRIIVILQTLCFFLLLLSPFSFPLSLLFVLHFFFLLLLGPFGSSYPLFYLPSLMCSRAPSFYLPSLMYSRALTPSYVSELRCSIIASLSSNQMTVMKLSLVHLV